MWAHGGLSRWHNGIRTSSTSWCQDISPSGRISVERFNFALSMEISMIVVSNTTTLNAWHFPGKGQMKWTRSVDADGRSSRTGNFRGEFIFMKGMTQGSLRKKRDEQRGERETTYVTT